MKATTSLAVALAALAGACGGYLLSKTTAAPRASGEQSLPTCLEIYSAFESADANVVGAVIASVATEKAPPSWLPCDGRVLPTKDYPELAAIVGRRFTENQTPPESFALPDYRGMILAQAPILSFVYPALYAQQLPASLKDPNLKARSVEWFIRVTP